MKLLWCEKSNTANYHRQKRYDKKWPFITMCDIQSNNDIILFNDLGFVWSVWRHVVDQFAARLSETCRTGLLMSADPVGCCFVHTLFCHHGEPWRTVCDSVPQGWATHPAARSPAQYSSQADISASWYLTKYETHYLYVTQLNMCPRQQITISIV